MTLQGNLLCDMLTFVSFFVKFLLGEFLLLIDVFFPYFFLQQLENVKDAVLLWLPLLCFDVDMVVYLLIKMLLTCFAFDEN